MSLVKIEEIHDINGKDEQENSKEVIQCCDQHFLINSHQDFNNTVHLKQLQLLINEKNHLVANLERENLFLKEQVRSLNLILDQLSVSAKNMAATKNDIRISVENSTSVSMKKWYNRPRIVLSSSAIVVLFSIYLRYKIKNW